MDEYKLIQSPRNGGFTSDFLKGMALSLTDSNEEPPLCPYVDQLISRPSLQMPLTAPVYIGDCNQNGPVWAIGGITDPNPLETQRHQKESDGVSALDLRPVLPYEQTVGEFFA
ncbi:hypothetical protein AAHC03_01802 [Spirometra sp. Aus1]